MLGWCTVYYDGVMYIMVVTVCQGVVLYVRAVYCMLGRCTVC